MTVSRDEPADSIAFAQWSPVAPFPDDFHFRGWKSTKPIYLTHYWSGAAAPVSRHAEARIIWSDEGLHVLYDCHQEEPLIVASNPQTTEKTLGLWERDVCEIFIAPDPVMPENYFEFEAAPTEEWLDVAIKFNAEGRQSNWGFQSEMTVAAKEERSRILISIRIPWSSQITKPSSRAKWRVNLFRCVGSGVGRGYLAWQPTLTEEPNFHVPEVFGWLHF